MTHDELVVTLADWAYTTVEQLLAASDPTTVAAVERAEREARDGTPIESPAQ